MLLPGTFLGVWNLFAISGAQSTSSIPTAWIQAHGHAQLFGWIGSFIIGIGFYSIQSPRQDSTHSFWEAWLSWWFWMAGIVLRWLADVCLWQWRILLPLSAMLELLAVVIFFACSCKGHRKKSGRGAIEPWTILVIGGTVGLLVAMCLNSFESIRLASSGVSPVFPTDFNLRLLVLSVWGFAVPVALGLTAHWMPHFLGLKPTFSKLILPAFVINCVGLLMLTAKTLLPSAVFLSLGTLCTIFALRLFERPEKPARVEGVHQSFPVFIRLAYTWLIVASLLSIWQALSPDLPGVAGAARHAVTVGFLMTMVFCVAPCVLPALLDRLKIYSTRLMLIALLFSNIGCLLRVTFEILAFQHYVSWAWSILPISATLELVAVVVFSLNMLRTFLSSAVHNHELDLHSSFFGQ